jgi:hypothetical protein
MIPIRFADLLGDHDIDGGYSAAGAASPDRRIRRRGTCTPMAVTIAANTIAS